MINIKLLCLATIRMKKNSKKLEATVQLGVMYIITATDSKITTAKRRISEKKN